MRGTLWAVALVVGVTALVGCHHDKYNMTPPVVEEYKLPPDEKRYNEPDTARYRKPPPPKEEKTLLGRPMTGMPGSGGF